MKTAFRYIISGCDELAVKLAVPYKDAWVWLTGKSNFSLAFFTNYLWISLTIVYFFLILREHDGVGSVAFGGLILVAYTVIGWDDRREFRKLQKQAQRTLNEGFEGSIPEWWVEFFLRSRGERALWMFLAMFQLPVGTISLNLSGAVLGVVFLLRVLSIWSALLIDFGGTSAFARAKKKVGELMPRRAPVLAPAPTG